MFWSRVCPQLHPALVMWLRSRRAKPIQRWRYGSGPLVPTITTSATRRRRRRRRRSRRKKRGVEPLLKSRDPHMFSPHRWGATMRASFNVQHVGYHANCSSLLQNATGIVQIRDSVYCKHDAIILRKCPLQDVGTFCQQEIQCPKYRKCRPRGCLRFKSIEIYFQIGLY